MYIESKESNILCTHPWPADSDYYMIMKYNTKNLIDHLLIIYYIIIYCVDLDVDLDVEQHKVAYSILMA